MWLIHGFKSSTSTLILIRLTNPSNHEASFWDEKKHPPWHGNWRLLKARFINLLCRFLFWVTNHLNWTHEKLCTIYFKSKKVVPKVNLASSKSSENVDSTNPRNRVAFKFQTLFASAIRPKIFVRAVLMSSA